MLSQRRERRAPGGRGVALTRPPATLSRTGRGEYAGGSPAGTAQVEDPLGKTRRAMGWCLLGGQSCPPRGGQDYPPRSPRRLALTGISVTDYYMPGRRKERQGQERVFSMSRRTAARITRPRTTFWV